MLKGTKTEKNLLAAFAGESQAHTKYQYYAQQAKKEGYEQIAEIFTTTSENEKAHAKIWFEELHNNQMTSTVENLNDAIAGENYEWSKMYKQFSIDAKNEGFDKLAYIFDQVGKIEGEHEHRFVHVLDNIQSGEVFKKKTKQIWICRNCGHIHEGEKAPEMCPVCSHPKAYFEIRVINY